MSRSLTRALCRIIGASCIAAGLVACSAMSSTLEAPPLDGTSWVLQALPGVDASPGPSITLRFEGGRASGSDGCNRYGVGVRTEGAAIETAGAIAGTRMACAPDVMQRADAYLSALGSARRYRIDGGRLQLLDADGRVRATFAAQSQSLAGTRWRATGIHDGRGAVASLVAGSTVTLAFGADGRASGSAGCNGFNAPYEATGAALRFGSAAATRRMCSDPALMAQETAFLKALETVASARIEGPRLELRRADGALAVALQAEDAR